MKLSEVSRYWAARELTRIDREGNTVQFRAPFACPDFTVRFGVSAGLAPRLRVNSEFTDLKEVASPLKLAANTWRREGEQVTICFSLPKGTSQLLV